MLREEVCQVYREPYSKARPLDLKFKLVANRGSEFTGLEEVL